LKLSLVTLVLVATCDHRSTHECFFAKHSMLALSHDSFLSVASWPSLGFGVGFVTWEGVCRPEARGDSVRCCCATMCVQTVQRKKVAQSETSHKLARSTCVPPSPAGAGGVLMERSIAQLSGGEKKRVALALGLGFAEVVAARGRLTSNILVLDEVGTTIAVASCLPPPPPPPCEVKFVIAAHAMPCKRPAHQQDTGPGRAGCWLGDAY
jgi:hypothetical protein